MKKFNNAEFLILAADSPTNFLKTKTDTYKDSTNQFIGKVITSNDSNKIYFFSKNIYKKSQLEITILHSQDKFNISHDGMPIIISPKKIIDKIKIKIIN
jgi:dsRNA-specific ribonuclease